MNASKRVVGQRGRVGVVIPSTNTVVEHDLGRLPVDDVTFHFSRFFVEAPDLDSDDAFIRFLEKIRETVPGAVRDVVTSEPDHILMGMSAESFWGGAEGNAAFEAGIAENAGGRAVTSGASACAAALARLGVDSIACVTPYQPIGDEQVEGYFSGLGLDVKAVNGLCCSSATSIADVTPGEMIDAFKAVDDPSVQAIVQCGTNLSAVGVADEAERWLGKPVLAINSLSAWHALRAIGVNDQFAGHGVMLREF